METRTVEQVESWNTRSFSDGYAGLRELSDGEFSGAVRAGGAWLFMLNGRVIGVYEGSLDDFEDADGTAYAAPHPSLPLLFSMREQGGETRAKYYTNDTPLSEADSTLTQGKFTGYVELSENVLSGDYYVAYYGGRSMSVAFVGASEQVVTGDDAFERAADEVGIYEVRDVEIDIIDLPEPEEPDHPDQSDGTPGTPASGARASGNAPSDGPSGNAPKSNAGSSSSQTTTSAVADAPQTDATRADESNDATVTDTTPTTTASSDTTPTETASTDAAKTESPATDAEPKSSPGQARSGEPTGTGATEASTTDRSSGAATDRAGASADETDASADRTGANTATTSTETASAEAASTGAAGAEVADTAGESPDDEPVFDEEKEWQEATTIPSLDPDRSEGLTDERERESGATADSGSPADSGATRTQSESAATPTERSQTTESASPERQSRNRSATTPSEASSSAASGSDVGTPEATTGASESAQSDSGGQSAERVRKLRRQLEQRKQQVQQLKDRLSTVESERNEYKRERDALRQEVERLEAKLEASGSGGTGRSGRQLDRAQAFDGTNLFVRYQSKGEATLEEAAAGNVDAEDVNANLRIEHHTQFEADDASVDGRPFEEFLTDSFEYRFVAWIIEELLYEIRDTGHRGSLRDLYEAIPAIDRVDLHGSVDAGRDDDDTRQESFDVIMRDRMGNPLVVADLNGSREPTTGEMMGSLVDAASGVAESHDELSAAFQVNESFFQPAALKAAETATSGGFLSREKRESFVKLSRKRGYHLCLVESRSGDFHLNVPEL